MTDPPTCAYCHRTSKKIRGPIPACTAHTLRAEADEAREALEAMEVGAVIVHALVGPIGMTADHRRDRVTHTRGPIAYLESGLRVDLGSGYLIGSGPPWPWRKVVHRG